MTSYSASFGPHLTFFSAILLRAGLCSSSVVWTVTSSSSSPAFSRCLWVGTWPKVIPPLIRAKSWAALSTRSPNVAHCTSDVNPVGLGVLLPGVALTQPFSVEIPWFQPLMFDMCIPPSLSALLCLTPNPGLSAAAWKRQYLLIHMKDDPIQLKG